GEQGIQPPLRILPGDATLSRLAQSSQVPFNYIEAGANLFDHHRLQVLDPLEQASRCSKRWRRGSLARKAHHPASRSLICTKLNRGGGMIRRRDFLRNT